MPSHPQDQHAAELKVYRQRLKHLLYEHAGAAARLAAQGEAALKEQVGGRAGSVGARAVGVCRQGCGCARLERSGCVCRQG